MQDWTWDLSIFYQSFDDPKIEEDIEKLKAQIKHGHEVLEKGLSERETLEALVDAQEKIAEYSEDLSYFATLTLSVDAENEAAAKLMDRMERLFVDVSLFGSAIVRYLDRVEDLEQVIASSPRLQAVDFALLRAKEEAKHLMPAEIEPWMLKMSLTGGEAFSTLRDKLDATLLVDYKCQKLPLSAVRALAYDPDEKVRASAYEAELAAYKKIEISMAACLNSIKGQAQTMCEAKRYASVLDMTLSQSNMDKETLNAMWQAIDESLPKFRAYLRRKGELLGHKNGLPFYDLFAPMTVRGAKTKRYTVEEARQKLITEMGKFSPDVAKFIDNAFENRWIDMFPRAGKGGGAFCAGAHAHRQSRVMTNFAGSFSDVSTIAHELGHAWHNEQMADLPYLMIDAPMPLAETASIFNETLLSHAVREQVDKKEAFSLLENYLMETTQTIVDIYSRFLFENAVVESRKNHALSVEELKAAMLDAQEKSYGDGLNRNIRHPYMWACKSHYYSPAVNFYNFPYAFGELFGLGMFAMYKEQGTEFVPKYNKLLSLCGSKMVADVAASVGIDVRSVDFWRSSLKIVTDDIDEFIRLADELCGEGKI